jgi:hypothetical protein
MSDESAALLCTYHLRLRDERSPTRRAEDEARGLLCLGATCRIRISLLDH